MSGEYTPTVDEVRGVYVASGFRENLPHSHQSLAEWRAEFDRWLVRVRAEAQIHILREVVDYLESVAHEIDIRPATAYSSEGLAASVAVGECANFIRDEAARIAREAGIEQEDEG